jgi:hypothetical protein
MEKEFVPYELALELKILGFDEPCLGWYPDETHFSIRIVTKQGSDSNNVYNWCLSPLYQQAFRWFREKYKLFSIVFYHTDNKIIFEHPYYFRIYEAKHKGKKIEHSKEFENYKEAQLECLKKLIEIVKNSRL